MFRVLIEPDLMQAGPVAAPPPPDRAAPPLAKLAFAVATNPQTKLHAAPLSATYSHVAQHSIRQHATDHDPE